MLFASETMHKLSRTHDVDVSSHSSEFLALLLAMSEDRVLTHFVRELSQLGQERINEEVSKGRGTVAEAIAINKPSLLPLALRCGADVNQVTRFNDTIFASAMKMSRDIALVQEMLSWGANVNPEADSRSPLFLAVQQGSLAMVELLISKGADPNPSKPFKPLQEALSRGKVEIAQLLLSHGADPSLCDPEAVAESPFPAFEWYVKHSGYSARAQVDKEKSLIYLTWKALKRKLSINLDFLGLCRITVEEEADMTEAFEESVEEYRQKVKLLLDHGADAAVMCE